MLDDFKRALARVHADYAFYIACQADPAAALATYDLTDGERELLSNPERLADALNGASDKLPSITITISGKHDWVNRTRTTKAGADLAANDAEVAARVAAIGQAGSSGERSEAVLRLMELIG
jgi:hypothetical protein